MWEGNDEISTEDCDHRVLGENMEDKIDVATVGAHDEDALDRMRDDTPVQKKISLPAWLWHRLREITTQVGVGRSEFVCGAIKDKIQDPDKWWNRENGDPTGLTQLQRSERRIADLEVTLERVLIEARGDGREATTPEWQLRMRTARAILENRLVIKK